MNVHVMCVNLRQMVMKVHLEVLICQLRTIRVCRLGLADQFNCLPTVHKALCSVQGQAINIKAIRAMNQGKKFEINSTQFRKRSE